MKRAFVLQRCDLPELEEQVLSKLDEEPILCSPYSVEPYSSWDRLQEAIEIYFVLSLTSVCSTQYTMMLMELFPATGHAERFKLYLDDVGQVRALEPGATNPTAQIFRQLPQGNPTVCR